MVLIVFIFAIFIYGVILAGLAIPGGLFFMLLLDVLHANISTAVPIIGFGPAYLIVLLSSLTLLFALPRSLPSSDD